MLFAPDLRRLGSSEQVYIHLRHDALAAVFAGLPAQVPRDVAFPKAGALSPDPTCWNGFGPDLLGPP